MIVFVNVFMLVCVTICVSNYLVIVFDQHQSVRQVVSSYVCSCVFVFVTVFVFVFVTVSVFPIILILVFVFG